MRGLGENGNNGWDECMQRGSDGISVRVFI